MKVNILLIQEHSARDDYFLKNLAESLAATKEKFLIFHQPINANKVETWFYTKRISAKLSESMIGNLPFSADLKNIFFLEENQLTANKEIFFKNLHLLQAIVINSVFKDTFIEFPRLLETIDSLFEIQNKMLFTQNPLSPLGATEPIFINSLEQILHYRNIYPEEKLTLNLAETFMPIYLGNPQSLAKIF